MVFDTFSSIVSVRIFPHVGHSVGQVHNEQPPHQNLIRCKQRGLQRFFGQILTIYSRFCSILFTLRHSLKTVFPRVPRLSVAGYVVKKIVSPKETVHKHNEALCNSLAFHLCISPFILSTFASYFGIVLLAKAPQSTEN